LRFSAYDLSHDFIEGEKRKMEQEKDFKYLESLLKRYQGIYLMNGIPDFLLKTEFESWSKSMEQTDDVLVIGIKF